MVVLAPHGEVAKALIGVRLATHKAFCDGLELLATTLAGKYMTTLLPKFKLVRR